MDCSRSNDETECPRLRLIQSKYPQPGIKNIIDLTEKKLFFKFFNYINLTWSWFSNGSSFEYSGNKEFKKISFFSRIWNFGKLLLKETFISWLIIEIGFCLLSLFLTTSNLKKMENKIFNPVNDIQFSTSYVIKLQELFLC